MANPNTKNPGNVPGPYYVDDSCIDCDLCRENAPMLFRRDEELGMSLVFRQPSTPEERHQAHEAMQGCPTESIGDDGDHEMPKL